MLSLITLFLGYRAVQLQFDYDFEKFFPEEDNDLEFFKTYRETFENDNDFVLFAIENKAGIFQQEFLQDLKSFTEELGQLPYTRGVISPITAKYPKVAPGGLGVRLEPYLHADKVESYRKDSLFFAESVEVVASMLSLESRSVSIILKNEEYINKEHSVELIEAINETIEKYDFDGVHYISKIHGQEEYINIMRMEFLVFMSLSVFILMIFLWLTYRSLWGIIIPLLTVLVAMLGSMGFMQLSGRPLNMMTTLLPVIMLVVGMSDVVHLVSKYLEEIRLGSDRYTAIKQMLKKVGVATLLTSITTAVGFATLLAVNMEPVRDFGFFTACGVLIAFVFSIVLIPSIFSLMKPPKVASAKRRRGNWDERLGKWFLSVVRYRKAWLLFYVFITALSFYGASKIKFDYFLMQDLDEASELMQELKFFQQNYGGIRPFELALIAKGDYKIDDFEVMQEIEKVEAYLMRDYGVNQLISPSIPFKFINKIARNGREEYYRLPERKKRYDYLKKKMEEFGDTSIYELIAPNGKMGRMYGRLIDAGSAEMLRRNETFDDFFQAEINSDLLDYRLTGTPVVIDQSSRYLSQNILTGLLIAFLIISVMMGFLFRSIKMALLSLVPNIFPILLTGGLIGFFNVPLNMATSIVFTVAFGIAVDDTIHFLSRYRQESKRGLSALWAIRRTYISTGRAIVVTTLILLGGFCSLILSDFLSTYYVGLFVSLTLLFAVITDLTLLPLLLLGIAKKKKK